MTRKALLLSFVIASVLFFATGSYRNWPYKVESDGKYYYHYLVSLAYDHDIDLTNDYARLQPPYMRVGMDPYGFGNRLTETGKPLNVWTLGPALLWLPFFGGAYAIGSLLNWFHLASISLGDGWSLFFQYGVMFAAVVYATLGLWLATRLLRQWFSEGTALGASLLVFWATNLAYYTFQEPSMSHVYDFFVTVLFFYMAVRAQRRGSWQAFVLWGLTGGLAGLVRTQNLATVALVAGYFGLRAVFSRHEPVSRVAGRYLAWAAGVLVALVPLVWQNQYLYGRAWAIPQGETWMQWTDPNLWDVLFSGRNGLFPHAPVLLLGLAGIVLLAFIRRSERAMILDIVLPLTIAVLAQWYINAAARDWWAGHGFGMRRLISSHLWFAFGLATLWKYAKAALARTGRNGSAAAKVLGALVSVTFVLISSYFIYLHVNIWDYDSPHDVVYYLTRYPPIAVRALSDKTPPEGRFDSPAPNAAVAAPVTLAVEAQDNAGGSDIARVTFITDATGILRAIGRVTTPPYRMTWDAAGAPVDRPFLVGVEIYDNAGNRTNRALTVTLVEN